MSMKTGTLVDRFGRVHNYLRISLTERCNFRCVYCMPEEGIPLRPRSEFMTRHEVYSLAETFVRLGITKIRLTGGEPLVRNDADEIITRLATLPVELAITTNGVLVDKFLDTFIAAGLRSVNISLDSLNEEKFSMLTRRNHFRTVMDNIRLLLEHDFHVKLNAVVMRDFNDSELIDFIEFTKDRNVHFRFIEFMPFAGNNWDLEKGLSYHEIIHLAQQQYGSRVIRLNDSSNDTAKNYQIEGYTGTFAVISSVTSPFCDTCNRLRLTADGKLKNCLFSNTEVDLLTPLRNGENIEHFIHASVREKHAARGGMDTLRDFEQQASVNGNRAMVAIGG
ncbi:MAG: GTP 3',8-cyclase MoaA [Chlorobi bacterium]|nr:MAG: GTP 3',8-cyclase MoaA [Bacteroidota bacterium]KXK34841.1 MAG: Molybdenum cofactor biosynthesis enzyme A [Chlorobi bacterium OLB6]MBE2265011.1 GTP 3',8-cyclase MoaA [Flavobacteriales bacterium]MBL1161557.1 GTP 3',8-cyclase MoaA [Chlorobiota bacterium]MBW7854140.1 GTP 3',8-cyclase MoaA [Candidatus Kapabacteria bacterium]MCC6332271.1 GTP 3',8-cyclase MoaA [Ignavibacteria bacterium]